MTPPAPAAVVFDLFGTLVDNFRRDEFAAVLAAMADAMAAPVGPFSAEVQRLIPGSLIGAYDIAGEALLACRALGLERSETQAAQAAARWRAWMAGLLARPRPGALETLAQIRGRGLRLGLLSDCARDVPQLWPASPLARVIDVPVFSAEEGVAKPAATVYRRACARLGVQPAAVLYVGDTADEVAGAQAAGLRPLRLLAPGERADTHLADRTPWPGPTIAALPEVLQHLDERRGGASVQLQRGQSGRSMGRDPHATRHHQGDRS